MEALLSDLLEAVNEYLSERVGLFFTELRFSDLERGMQNAAEELGYSDPRKCTEDLLASKLSKAQMQILVRDLTIGETYFFRDPSVFVALEERILPTIKKRKKGQRVLRLWSAGCSTGEEPYSIAISLLRGVPDLEHWQVTLLATDINTRSLEKAKRSTYTPWSFRTMPEAFLPEYFDEQEDGQYKLRSKVKDLVKFDYLNLAEDQFPLIASDTNDLDIIFCRNVLIYFNQQKCKEIADKLSDCLTPGGMLITSANDSARFISSSPNGMQRVNATTFVKHEK